MNSPSSPSRILLLADRRVPPMGGSVRIQRYRLARMPRDVRSGDPGRRLLDAKRV